MKKFAVLLVLAAAGCDSKPQLPPPHANLAQPLEASADVGAELQDATTAAVDAAPETSAPAPGECGGLVGVQMITLQPTEDGDPSRFRFGTEADALVYETEWTGDLNDDGVEDRIAVRRTEGPKTVRMVLVGCDDQFALAFVGVARSIAVAPETTAVNEREWKNLGVDSGTGIKTLRFDGEKYTER